MLCIPMANFPLCLWAFFIKILRKFKVLRDDARCSQDTDIAGLVCMPWKPEETRARFWASLALRTLKWSEYSSTLVSSMAELKNELYDSVLVT